MSEISKNKTAINGILQGLRRELTRRTEQAGTIEAITGGPVDRDLSLDYWRFSDTDLEYELWSRMPELDQAIDILPSGFFIARPGLWGRVQGRLKNLLLHLAMPLIRITLEKQDRLNRQFKHLQFIQFLTAKQLCQRMLRLESENRELGGRLTALEAENIIVGETSGHE
jgi:hypothetical protein